MKIEYIAPRVGLRMRRTAAGGDDSKRVTFFTPWSWQWDPDLSSNWIPFSGRSNLSLCAPFCSIIAPRHLNPPPLIVFYSFLILFLVDWFFSFFFFFFLSRLRHIRSCVFCQRGVRPVCVFLFFYFPLCIVHSMWTCISLHAVFSRGSREPGDQRGLDVQGDKARVEMTSPLTPAPRPKYKKASGLICICCIKTFPLLLPHRGRSRGKIWTNHPGRVLSDYIFIRCNVRRVERSSELMDDLIMGDWLYWFGWPYPHCLSGPLELRADTIPHRLKPPYSRNSSFRLH